MLLCIDNVLSDQALAVLRGQLEAVHWASGVLTAGLQSAQVKNNEQVAENDPQLNLLRQTVLGALSRNAQFFAATLPSQIFPPMFNRYGGEANVFGSHVDNAMRPLPDGRGYLRTDVSATLFLSDPGDYDGGELVIEDTYGTHVVKLAAGSMVVYPATSIHEVKPVTRGYRVACFMWMQSMVRDAGQRRLLYDMDMALLQLRESHGDTDPVIRLTGTYHNLLRCWADA
jgi:PKHD-type hydroxylase